MLYGLLRRFFLWLKSPRSYYHSQDRINYVIVWERQNTHRGVKNDEK